MKTKLTPLFVDFFESEKASGIVLIVCTLLSMVIANSHFGTAYLDFWHVRVGLEIPNIVVLHHNLERWVNDGLMAIFFLLIGLEIEREIYIGELSSPKQASLPMAAAIGGMLVPALLHFFFNQGTATTRPAQTRGVFDPATLCTGQYRHCRDRSMGGSPDSPQ